MSDIIAVSKNESFIILKSVGIKVVIDDSLDILQNAVKTSILEGVRIIIYDQSSEIFMNPLLEKYDEKMYPIFLKLPTGIKNEDTLKELKTMIEKSIGISII